MKKIVFKILSLLIVTIAVINVSSLVYSTEIPQGEINSTSYGSYNTYSAAQTAFMEQNNNVFYFNAAATADFRNIINASKYRGQYILFTEITQDQLELFQYRAEVPGSPGVYYSHTINNYTFYLARFWDLDWLNARLNWVDNINSGVDWVFLDVMNLKRFDWIPATATLPYKVDTDAEWRARILDVAAFARANIPAHIDIVVNSIQNNGTNPLYDGYDAVGAGLGDFALMEGFDGGLLSNQFRTMQFAARAKILQKRIMIKSPFTTDIPTRLSHIAKYLLVGDLYYTDYELAPSAWAPKIPEYLPENYIDWGAPIDSVSTDIINTTPQEKIYIRRWDSGFVGLVNLASATQAIPSQYLGYKKLNLSGDVQIDSNGATTAKWDLITLTDSDIIPYAGIVLYSDINPPSAPTGLVVE